MRDIPATTPHGRGRTRYTASVGPRILLIDDIAATREPLADLLRRKGYAVDEANDGEAGLAELRQHPDTSLVVLDLMMPHTDGWWFRERQLLDPDIAGIPIIVFSVAGSPDLLKYSLHAREVLQKPGSVEGLFAAIEACCGPGRD